MGSQDRTNPFAGTRGDKSAMRPFAELLWTHVIMDVLRRNVLPVRCGVKLADSCTSGEPRDLAEHVIRLSEVVWSTGNRSTKTVVEQVTLDRKVGRSDGCGRQIASTEDGSATPVSVVTETIGSG